MYFYSSTSSASSSEYLKMSEFWLKTIKIGKMAKKWDFSSFFGHNSDFLKYSQLEADAVLQLEQKRIFDSSSGFFFTFICGSVQP